MAAIVKLHRLIFVAPLLAGLALPGALQARAGDPVLRAVHDFLMQRSRGLGEEVQVEVRPPAAQMPACDRPRPFMPGGARNRLGRVTVGVRCGGGHQRFLQARVSASGHYWVAAGRIAANTPISAGMLKRVRGDLARLPRGAVLDRTRIIGQVASRPLNAGAVVCDYQLSKPPLVERRQPVTVAVRGRGFRIARQARALESGALGESVRVRLADRSVLSATVRGPGQVEIIR
ncbi:flagellar basal body P-ring formation chaperone FlgA [Microbulbifer litoralis]|uniref:flagellar basal body P-ring formation chaperone FlgA n=1 Tax=Microbulbifer litoralis TaxID=2933965 RepID=UPI002027971D|nr:flagellar basal body P-ring formation chaperone FlgA [Microbulbifer sp. GX H0434]